MSMSTLYSLIREFLVLFFVSLLVCFTGGLEGMGILLYFKDEEYLNVKILLRLSSVVLTEVFEETAAFPNPYVIGGNLISSIHIQEPRG